MCAAGHARVYVAFDVLYRFLQHLGYDVQYVRNFTDVDDKIINRAAESGEDPLALSARFIDEFHTDMALLGCLSPTVSRSLEGCSSVISGLLAARLCLGVCHCGCNSIQEGACDVCKLQSNKA